MKILDQQALAAAGNNLRVKEGTFKHLYIILEGTNTAAQDIVPADLGTFTLMKNNKPIVAAVDQINMIHYGNHFSGLVAFSSTTGGAAYFVIPYFCYDPLEGKNVMQVKDDEQVNIGLTWGAALLSATGLASGTVYLLGDEASGIQNYVHKYSQYSFPVTASGIKEKIPGENFARMILAGMDDVNIIRVMAHVDNAQVHDATRLSTILASNGRNRIADASTPTGEITADVTAEIPIIANGQFDESLSDDLNLTIIADGAATIEVLVTEIDFTPQEAAETSAFLQSRIDSKIRRKTTKNKSRPVVFYEQTGIADVSRRSRGI